MATYPRAGASEVSVQPDFPELEQRTLAYWNAHGTFKQSVAAVIEWDKIGQLLWVAPLAGLAIAITYALMIVGWSRADEARRASDGGGGSGGGGGGLAAMAYSLLGLVSTVAFLAVVVYGVVVIVEK